MNVEAADGRAQAQTGNGKPFLWIDQKAERCARVQAGEVAVEPVGGRGTQDAPDGLIHDWVGAIFIPNATAESVSWRYSMITTGTTRSTSQW